MTYSQVQAARLRELHRALARQLKEYERATGGALIVTRADLRTIRIDVKKPKTNPTR